ncbi:MAG: hypothetical protein HKN19_00160 [Halioglobus sp.]|nr:hypothetical protein [Halioglobus sp.]
MSVAELTTFLGWCTVINFALLLIIAACISLMSDFMKGVHSSMYHVPESELDAIYFTYMANYKLLIFIFNLVPWFALKVMA